MLNDTLLSLIGEQPGDEHNVGEIILLTIHISQTYESHLSVYLPYLSFLNVFANDTTYKLLPVAVALIYITYLAINVQKIAYLLRLKNIFISYFPGKLKNLC